eukprot:5494917-Pyramimonas_sp.AAC.1
MGGSGKLCDACVLGKLINLTTFQQRCTRRWPMNPGNCNEYSTSITKRGPAMNFPKYGAHRKRLLYKKGAQQLATTIVF